jgi:hypothetical protein
VQKLSGDAAVTPRPAEHLDEGPRKSTDPSIEHFNYRKQIPANQLSQKKQGNQESRAKTARRSLHAGKLPNGVRWKNLLLR